MATAVVPGLEDGYSHCPTQETEPQSAAAAAVHCATEQVTVLALAEMQLKQTKFLFLCCACAGLSRTPALTPLLYMVALVVP